MMNKDNSQNMPDTFQYRFEKFIRINELFDPQERILLAVSGGVDSMVMAHLFLHCGFSFALAHCNFSLRGEESDGDEAFVKTWCLKNNIQLYTQRFNTLFRMQEEKISIQMAARVLRYEWFETLCKENNFAYCSLAHHKNDILETILINLIRGTGIAGLRGILPKSGIYIRPLLDFTKTDIQEEARIKNIDYREDSSNRSDKYIRNRLRQQVIPIFKEINPNLENTLGSHILSLRFTEFLAEEKKRELINQLWDTSPQNQTLSKKKIIEWGGFGAELLFSLLEEYSFTHSVCLEIFNHLNSRPGVWFYSKTHRIGIDRELLFLEPLQDGNPLYSIHEDPGRAIFSMAAHFLRTPIQNNQEVENLKKQILNPLNHNQEKTHHFSPGSYHAYFDMESLGMDLQFRFWEEGDAFIPLGMNHFKKLSDFFIDLKIPISEKTKIPLVLSQDKIIWVVGLRTDDRFKLHNETRSILYMEYRPNGN